MNNFFRGIIAAWGAKKLGGGCLSTIVIFILIYMALGKCSNTSHAAVQVPKTAISCKRTAASVSMPENKVKSIPR